MRESNDPIVSVPHLVLFLALLDLTFCAVLSLVSWEVGEIQGLEN